MRDVMEVLDGVEVRMRFRPRLYVYGVPVNWRYLLDVLRSKNGNSMTFDGWSFWVPYGLVYLVERESWIQDYSPPWDPGVPYAGLVGKTVMDVGAGCGETAKFYLDSGARLVWAVEKNKLCQVYLKENSRVAGDRLRVLPGEFTPEILGTIKFDLLKMDIEGYELDFYYWLKKNPWFNVDTVLEVHSVYIRDRFKELGFGEVLPGGWDPPEGFSTRIMYRWRTTQ